MKFAPSDFDDEDILAHLFGMFGNFFQLDTRLFVEKKFLLLKLKTRKIKIFKRIINIYREKTKYF
jgi:hypothetical protein